MKHGKILALASMAVLMLGCKADAPSAQEANAPASLQTPEATTATATLPAAQLLEQKLKKDMPYADLRKIVLAEGWLPLKTEDCKENVGGEALICDQQPETESCSGDGHCNMLFAHGATQVKLRVGTYDDSVKFFEFSTQAGSAVSPSTACSQQDYQPFFNSYVHSESVRISHTADAVVVRNYIDGLPIKVKFDGFKIGLLDNTWVYQDGNVVSKKHERIDLKIHNSANAFRVEFQKAEFAPVGDDEALIRTYGSPGAYLFELKDGCWQLTTEYR